MEFKELKNKSEKELKKILGESREKIRDLRFKDANKQLKNVREIRKIKKIISRTLTILNINKGKSGLVVSEAKKKEENHDKK